ncbi:hypothetical protein L227DRAFT_234120 [Lentinus tigrinus ALCF2SS1-6]|uniref:Uncharacterized protein n=1 Tax=Lentinus tigrinus ALCF2SS1-6 TaxID=1328759 RepID=A0A5C2S176_9APHY|nr:hypothetical protein L227DRAFT_234120 [Lentinus tigrinus ALCF2SS1-6]
MRKEAVYTVLLNATLFKGGASSRKTHATCGSACSRAALRATIICGCVRWSLVFVARPGGADFQSMVVQVSNAKIAEELLEEINAHIPME